MIRMKIKTCPFCGAMPELRPKDPKEEGDAWGEVACINTKCGANPAMRDGETVSDERGSDEYKKAAIRRWNKRA